jgi:hypothetical protein
MSFRIPARAPGADRLRSRLIVKTTRLALSVGLAAGLAVVMPATGVATAGASVVPAAHQGPGGGGNQGGGNQGGGNQGGGNQGGGGFGGGGFGGGGLGGFRHLVIVTGTVGSVGTTSFTLTRGFGPIMPFALTGTATTLTGTATGWTINVSQYTHFLVPGTTSPDLTDVLVGDKVTVTGRRAGAGMVNANLVVIPLELVTGAVGTVGAGSFTVPVRPLWSLTSTATTLTGTATAWTIDVSGSTTYHERGVASSTLTLGSLSSSDHVIVVGSQAGALTLNAITVLIEPPRGTGGGGGPGGGGGGGPGGGKHHHGF